MAKNIIQTKIGMEKYIDVNSYLNCRACKEVYALESQESDCAFNKDCEFDELYFYINIFILAYNMSNLINKPGYCLIYTILLIFMAFSLSITIPISCY